jgi:hypothetical protein
MQRTRTFSLIALSAAAALWGCAKDSTAPSTLVNDPQVAADVASSAGDAIATDVATMIGNEVNVALPAPGLNFDLFGVRNDSIVYTRNRTCFDASHVAVANCSPLSSVRYIVFDVTLNGTHTGPFVTAVVHRARHWTITRNFTGTTEVSRTHDGVGTSNDTSVVTSATAAGTTRTHELAAVDSAIAVTFNLPRATNPWPVSGTMVRRVSVHVVFVSPTQQATRDYTKRVEVDYPADAQGNVVLKIDSQTCNLNLVTHAVTGCH